MNSDLEIGRSLIQKAIRRADPDITRRATLWLIQAGDFEWVRKRLAVLTFEECWTYGLDVSYENDEKLILDHILQLARSVKNRNAAGLGALSYALSQSDESALSGEESDLHLRSVGKAIHQPEKFWNEARNKSLSGTQLTIVETAFRSFDMAKLPWDRAFILAAAYLAITEPIPETKFATPRSGLNFPMWIAIDMHTSKGVLAISEAARQINFDPEKALWLTFYLEGVICNEVVSSPWWEKEKIWRMKKLQLSFEEGQQIWERLKPVLIELLNEEMEKLRKRIFH